MGTPSALIEDDPRERTGRMIDGSRRMERDIWVMMRTIGSVKRHVTAAFGRDLRRVGRACAWKTVAWIDNANNVVRMP